MLVISRKVGEGFTIGDNVHVSVERLGGDKVRLGIVAPREIVILRDELEEQTIDHGPSTMVGQEFVDRWKQD
jgi:carbon storage regulator